MSLKILDIKKLKKARSIGSNNKPRSGSRRNFLKGLGFGFLAFQPSLKALGKAFGNDIQYRKRGKNITFYSQEGNSWNINLNSFDGSPKLIFRKKQEDYHLILRNAFYPGTTLPMDFKAILYNDLSWRIKITFTKLDISKDLNLADWINGNAQLNSFVYLQEGIELNNRYSLDIEDHYHFIIDKFWKITLQGKDLANYKLNNISGLAEQICFSFPVEKDLTFCNSNFEPKLKLSITTQNVEPFLSNWKIMNGSELNSCSEVQHQVQILKSERLSGMCSSVVLVDEKDVKDRKGFLFHKKINEDLEETLKLYRSQLAIELNQQSEKFIFIASIASNGIWTNSSEVSYQLINSKKNAAFEMHGTNGRINSVNGLAQVAATKYLLPDAISLAVEYPEKPAIEIEYQDQKLQSKKKLVIDSRLGKIKIKEKEIIRLSVLRPEDMLFLQFEFYNFKYIKKDQLSYLEINNTKKPATMVVVFPPQHTLEQAFWENNSLPGGEGNENVILPAKYIRSGKSRLVYSVPSSFKGMPIIMEELLNWSRFKLRVNYRARVLEPVKVVVNKFQNLGSFINKKSTSQPKTISRQSLSIAKYSKNRLSSRSLYNKDQLSKNLPAEVSGQLYVKINYAALKANLLEMRKPNLLETSIEAPTRLFISPNQLAGFAHQQKIHLKDHKETPKGNIQNLQYNNPLITNKGKLSELWHSRMGVRLKNGEIDEEGMEGFRSIRALWARDAFKKLTPKPPRNKPFRTALDGRDRHNIVHQTSNFTIKSYTPRAVQAKRFMMSSLGAWIDFNANFNYPDFHAQPDLELLEWEHLSTLGRDHYVKVVEAGFLFPFGHTAALVKITERKPDKTTRAAVNRQRIYIVILEPVVYYEMRDQQNGYIPFPFQTVEMPATRTPDLDAPVDLVNMGGDYNFLIRSGGTDLIFDLLLVDQEGREQKIKLPLIFIGKSAAYDEAKSEQLVNVYNAEMNRFKADFNLQMVAYSPSLIEDDTTFETSLIDFGALSLENKAATVLKFHPKVKTASVKVKAIEELTGNPDPVNIELQDDENAAKVFAKVLDNLKADFSSESDKSGGFMSPNTQVTSLSKLKGPLGGAVDKLQNLEFDPSEFFASSGDMPVAKLFGVVSIFDLLLGNLNFGDQGNQQSEALSGISQQMESLKEDILEQQAILETAAEDAQTAIEQEIQNLRNQLESKVNELEQQLTSQIPRIPNFNAYKTDKAFVVEYRWIPEMEASKSLFGGFLTVNVQKPNEALQVLSKLSRPFDTSQKTQFGVNASFTDFSVEIKELIRVSFKSLKFGGGSGKKADVKVEMAEDDSILFLGPLSFVNQLQNLIPSNGFADGPYMKLSPAGVKAGFDLAIPSVEVGVCTIANMTLGAGVHLPFTGAPLTLSFNFCKRESPFLLTVSAFGGGGYFLMKTSVKGFVGMEAAFEFGAALSMNFGVASGGVSVMGGFYFSMEIVDDHTETILTGYIRFNGYLSILGIISLSLEIYLAFVAMFQNGKVEKLYGEAIVKVKIEVLFFSKTVTLTARRELKGADADPTFQMIMEENDWLEYCQAYA
ncbi:coiled-coil domain-containing protein [Marinifilum flexuosum]|uniref:Uncharacterized protein n=1 Tax=Marinifilum flexuosum TaxID=1117708 RepID=A0A419XAV6_9BACT|nr:hypothetical protein [Marinifilum flexuosum]RKE04845.1 hypothetical protein BXY64_1876 [Marinifilum flexuosum]